MRKSTDYVSNQIRMREELRQKIEDSASDNKTSMNTEMVKRLEASYSQEIYSVLAGGKENLELLCKAAEVLKRLAGGGKIDRPVMDLAVAEMSKTFHVRAIEALSPQIHRHFKNGWR